MDISVVVVTYNPNYQKLLTTLKSVICQKDVEFEVIIADDGSKNFDKDIIKDFFSECNFYNYRLVLNEKNQGTMKNALSGWTAAKGKYIKQLSPGDYLYSNNTLYCMYNYIKKTGATLIFGTEASYSIENNKIELIDYSNPVDIRPYIEADSDAIINKYVVERQFANGMTFLVQRSKLLEYANLLNGKVKYGEDFTYLLMIAGEEPVAFLNTYVIWYEYGSGISTTTNSIWFERLDKDKKACYSEVSRLNKKLKNLKWKYYDYENENFFLRYLWKIYRRIRYSKTVRRQNKKNEQFTKNLPEPDVKHLLKLIDEFG